MSKENPGGCPTMFGFVRIALTKTSGMSGNPTWIVTVTGMYIWCSWPPQLPLWHTIRGFPPQIHVKGRRVILEVPIWYSHGLRNGQRTHLSSKFVRNLSHFLWRRNYPEDICITHMLIDHNPDHSSPCASQWHFIWSFDAHVVQILIQATVVVIEGWGYTIHWQCVSIGLQQIPQPNKTGKLLPCIYNLHTWIMMWSQFSQAADCTWQNKTTRKCKQKPMKTLYIIISIWIYKHETSTSSKAPYVRRPSV